MCTPGSSWRKGELMMTSGTQHSCSLCRRGRCTASSGCTGPKRCLSGQTTLRLLCGRCWGWMTDSLWTETAPEGSLAPCGVWQGCMTGPGQSAPSLARSGFPTQPLLTDNHLRWIYSPAFNFWPNWKWFPTWSGTWTMQAARGSSMLTNLWQNTAVQNRDDIS